MVTTTVNKIGEYQEILYSCQNELGSFKLGILNDYGATLNRLEIPFKNENFNLVKGYNVKDDFKKAYRGVLLAPFPNRIKNGQYTFDGKTYQLPINRPKENNALHGFLYNEPFEVIENSTSSNNSILILQNDYDGGIEGFPFKFKTTITYVWDAPYLLKVSIAVTNTDNKLMPLGLGWHPYFQFPQSINNITLKMDSKNKFLVDGQMIPSLETEPYTSFIKTKKIGAANFDDCFELNDINVAHQTVLTDKLNDISLTIEQDTSAFKYLQVYTAPARDCIAIEPMTCIPDAFNNQLGLKKLKPNEIYNCTYTIRLKLGKV